MDIKKVLFLIITGVFLSDNGYCDLQYDEIVSKRTNRLFLIGKAEWFGLKDEEVRGDYGMGDRGFSVGGGIPLSSRFSVIASLDSSKKIVDEEWLEWLDITPVTLSCIYNLSDKTPNSYIGGGIGYYSVERKRNIYAPHTYIVVASEIEKNKAIGYHLLLGTEWLVSPRISINGEIKYSMANIKDWENMDIGGWNVGAGIGITLGNEGRSVEFERWKKEPKKGKIIGTLLGGLNGGMIGFLFCTVLAVPVALGGGDPDDLYSLIIVPTVVGGIIGYEIGDRYDKK